MQKLGYRIAGTANSADAALAIIQAERPDLVLMDINLGTGMNGIEAAELIRHRYKVPVIYVTSYSDEDTLAQAKRSMPYGFINKPFRGNDLRVNIEIALSRDTRPDVNTLDGETGIRGLTANTPGYIPLSEVLDYLVTGVIVIDEELEISYMNRSAANILKEGKVLQLRDNSLYIANPGIRKQIREQLRKDNSGMVTIGMERDELHILLFPVDNPATYGLKHNRGSILFIFSNRQDSSQIEDVIRSLYKLSPTEARVASMLVFNPYLDEVAATLGITYNTAKTHMKRIYQKTETNKLPALILKIITGPAGLLLHSSHRHPDQSVPDRVSSSMPKS